LRFSKNGLVVSNGPQAPGLNGRSHEARSADDRPIIVHSHLRWDFVWQRPQQIFSRLAAHHAILFLEEPVLQPGEPALLVSEPHPNIIRVVPILPPDLDGVNAQCEATLAMLRPALREHALLSGRFDSPIQWFYSPMPAPCFLAAFGPAAVVYDCMDELANFRFAPPDLAERERLLLSKANVVFTGGYELFQSKSRHHDNVHFFGCGVDVDHYRKARSAETPVPREVAHLPRPIFGYFGVIDERIDYDLVAQLAATLPHASVVMIGPLAKVEPEMLPRPENIHWLGQRAYDDLPAFLKAFDVCLMPFALNEATRYINPTKTLEYMTAGKPIVSTAVPDVVRNFAPVVDVAHSPAEFVLAVRRAFENPELQRIEEGLRRASGASWEAVVGSMRRHMLEALPRGDRPAPHQPGDFP
jgi:glycosyltransferase involved in cell wall biosynthesis